MRALVAWRGGLFLTEEEIRVLSVSSLFLILNACILSAENAHAPVHAHLCNGAETSLSWKLLRTFLESCVSLVQAVVFRLPCCQ